MVELQQRALAAAPAAPRYESTLAAITQPDGALDACWDVARPFGRRPFRPRLRCLRELLPCDVLEQQLQRSVEDRGGIAVRDLAAQEFLCASQVRVGLWAHRELHP